MNKEHVKQRGMRWATLVFVFVATFAIATHIVPSPRLVTDEQGFSHIEWDHSAIVLGVENSTIGAAASGFLEIYFVNHSTTPYTAYGGSTHNSTDTLTDWANASLDPDGTGTTYHAYANYSGFSLTLKWGTAFDIVVRYRGNETNAANATMFKNSSCRVKINASGGGVTLSEVTLTNCETCNSSDDTFIWFNAYADNSGSGYTLNKGGTCTITNIKIEFNY